MSGLDLLADCRGLVLGVSGANSVGYHCARLLAAHGATVAITYRPARAPACGPLLAAGALARGLEVDVQDEASIQAAVECLGAEWGRIDFIVHAIVGVPEGTLGRPLLALTREEYREVMEVTAYSLIAACRHAAPWMTRSAHPRVVALTSPAAQRTTPNYHAVGIAKAALSTALLYLGAELGPRGILCNGVGFSLIETDGARRAVGEKLAAATRTSLQKRAPTRQAVEYEHIARTVAFLASPLCANMTGEILTVDGGFSRTYL